MSVFIGEPPSAPPLLPDAAREERVLADFEAFVSRARDCARRAAGECSRWRERVVAVVAALLELLDEDPALARLAVVETLAAGPSVRCVRAEVLAELARAIDLGRCEPQSPLKSPPAAVAEQLLGTALTAVHESLLRRPPSPLRPLAGVLTGLILLPYVGELAARVEVAASAMVAPDELL